MNLNNGTSVGAEPGATGAPAANGMEQQGLGQPAGSQGTGAQNTLEGAKGAASPSWMAQLPNDLKHDSDLQQYATLGDFVRSTKQNGKDGNEGDGDQKDQGNEPVKYEKFEKGLDANSDPFGTISESLKGMLEESGVSQAVAEKVFDTLAEGQKGSMSELIEKGKDWCEAQLKKSWGPQYETKRNAMTRAYVALVQSDKDLAGALDRTGASINPAVAELLSRVGESIKEDGSFPSNGTTSGTGRNPKVPVRYPD